MTKLNRAISKKTIAIGALALAALAPYPALAETPQREAKCLIEIDTPWGDFCLIPVRN